MTANGLSVEEAAGIAGVSAATIRNWGKTGYLTQIGRGLISKDSLAHFMHAVAGTSKLTARANKSMKDTHDHARVSRALEALIRNHRPESMGEAYADSLSEAHRNREGIFYTPPAIAADMLKGIIVGSDTSFLDPCCGSGTFLVEALKKGVKPENVFGFDPDANAVEIARTRIRREFGTDAPHLRVGDFLDAAVWLSARGESFDLIFTNPPWGKKLPKLQKHSLAKQFGSGRTLDTSALFLFASLKVLKPGGMLGFLLQEAFFNIAGFEDARKRILEKQIIRLTDYGKPFKKLLTRAQAIVICNEPSTCGGSPSASGGACDPSTHGNNEPVADGVNITCLVRPMVKCTSESRTYFRAADSFRSNPGTIFNFWAGSGDAAVIERMYSLPHKTLKGNAGWALGIVTGNNAAFCSDRAQKGYVPVYKGADISPGRLKKPSAFIPQDFTRFQQVAPMGFYQAKEKLIYRFIHSRLCFYHDTRQRFILNSANLLIPDENLGLSCRQLADLMNSEPMNWLFRKLFRTHKILRRDLESLPIHVEYFRKNPVFNESTYLEYLGLKKTSARL